MQQLNQKMFRATSANNWIDEVKDLPTPNMLFSEFWVENEICILFADTNVGKTILAVQIANSISKGIPIEGFKMEAEKQKVIYFDFELSAKQFQLRYTCEDCSYENKYYQFDENFIRAEIDQDYEYAFGKDKVDAIIKQVEICAFENDAKIIVIDNITYINDDVETAKFAAPLMKSLKTLKKTYGYSILVVAHTPKRDLSKALSINDLAGSKQLANFTDSCFAINKSSREEELRYIKQLKVRFSGLLYGTDNIVECNIVKKFNILEFEYKGFGLEQAHLKERTLEESEQRLIEAKSYKDDGWTNVKIANHFNVTEGAVRKWFNKVA